MDNEIRINEAMDVAKNHIISSKTLFEAEQYRNSITISYYAMFTAASALLLKKGISPKSHEGVLRQLGKEYVKDGTFSKEVYKTFSYAKIARKDASYDFSVNFSKDLAQKTIWDAEKFIEEVEKLL